MSRNPQGEPRTVAGRAFYEAGLAPGDRRWWSRATTDPDEMLRAILAIEDEAAAPVEGLREALDAERLARAMARVAEVGPPAHIDPDDAEEHWPSYLDEAQAYAAEYAALWAIESPAHPETASPRQRADAALAEMGLMLREWQPMRCGAFGGTCSWGGASHDGSLVPDHEYEPIPDGPVLFVLERFPAP